MAGWDGQARALLVVADAVKPTSAEAIRQLRQLGLTPVLPTGDNETVSRFVAAEVGIDQVIAEVLPKDKVDVVVRLQSQGKVVAMVGTGSTTTPRWRRPIWGWPWAPAPTWRSRPPT